jgi:hypothetical protein
MPRTLQAYIWEDKVFRSDFVGGRLTRNVISAAELDAKIAGAARAAPGPPQPAGHACPVSLIGLCALPRSVQRCPAAMRCERGAVR